MLATFVIGLREGLEAALIVGIIAAFLRQNGRSLRPLWIGVTLALLLSAAVGIALKVVESSLPQAAQEGMETVIGAVAVVFVTGMVLWMMTHARGLKKELESSAREALGSGSSRALAVMAFLAVLKEGFETSVFLLATFQASTNPALAATGAVLGVLAAVAVGIGIYRGGVRLNLAKFFKFTGAFLLLVAAGLVVTALRTAHEAGWLNAGQQRTLDLTWLAPAGSVRGALLTGVLGIPTGPRLIEVLGWCAYLVPMALLVYWPVKHRAGAVAAGRIRLGAAAALVLAAAVLATAYPAAGVDAPHGAPLTSDGSSAGTARLAGDTLVRTTAGTRSTYPLGASRPSEHQGILTAQHTSSLTGPLPGRPSSLTSTQLLSLNGGRMPVGVNASQSPGPYTAQWTRVGERDVWVSNGVLVDATQSVRTVLSLRGGGLAGSRTLTLTDPGTASESWSVRPAYASKVASSIRALDARSTEARFWSRTLPLALVVAAALVLLTWWRRRPHPLESSDQTPTTTAPRSRSSVDVR
ncbi:iron uptake transporter permease EfeU [Allobranchiibius sp. GilTou73]|uniref:iron uptake transporter permease EfeU n=1 Tax=Allobranchiibius sp. GilTou73 TaxID=2904523 RepID=UPI001F329D1D|nr:iron uptake transporter permease EfeU [Allobranchiibius sp. GilTou73]UIJ34211.1 FTR1 family protein [Allobranchiibius sp. GilTou73]